MANFIRDGVRRCTRHPTAPCLAAARALMSGRPPVQMRFFVGPVSQGRQNVVLCPYWVEAYGTDRERAFLEAVAPRADLPEDVVDRSILELLNDDLYPLRMLDPDGHTVEVDRLEEDPYPPADYPQMTNKERRFFFYFTVAKLLLELAGWGQTNAGVRIRLPQPVYDYISELWGGAPKSLTRHDDAKVTSKLTHPPRQGIARGITYIITDTHLQLRYRP